jgi:hypothetical protein
MKLDGLYSLVSFLPPYPRLKTQTGHVAGFAIGFPDTSPNLDYQNGIATK